MSRITEFNWQEPTAYIVSITSLVLGISLGLAYDPAWLGRFGSVIIVCGVLLAASRKFDVLHAKALAVAKAHRREKFSAILSEFQNADGSPISSESAAELEERVYSDAEKEIATELDRRRRVFKIHEVSLVILGTLTNGFGEWVLRTAVSLSKCAI